MKCASSSSVWAAVVFLALASTGASARPSLPDGDADSVNGRGSLDGSSTIDGDADDTDPLSNSTTATTRVLFVGNSFTKSVPQQFEHVARSLGEDVEVHSQIYPGCTLFSHMPDRNAHTATLLSEQHWDFIVLQDYSVLPTIIDAIDLYFDPAVANFRARMNSDAKLVMFQTWGYNDGFPDSCPADYIDFCFPLQTLAQMTSPPCSTNDTYSKLLGSFECMGYALARGYGSVLGEADLIAPCGLAWQVVKGSRAIPAECRELIDSEYDEPFPITVPLQVAGAELPDLELYKMADGNRDKHPNVAGLYLNALTFYATIFGKSPVGAAPPLDIDYGDNDLPRTLTASEILALQLAAEGAVSQCGPACTAPVAAGTSTISFKQVGNIIWGVGCFAALVCLYIKPSRLAPHITRIALSSYLLNHIIAKACGSIELAAVIGDVFSTFAGLSCIILGSILLAPCTNEDARFVERSIVFTGVVCVCVVIAYGVLATQSSSYYRVLRMCLYAGGVTWGVLGVVGAISRHVNEIPLRCKFMAFAVTVAIAVAAGDLGLFKLFAKENVEFVTCVGCAVVTVVWLPCAVVFFRWVDDQELYRMPLFNDKKKRMTSAGSGPLVDAAESEALIPNIYDF